MTQLPSQDTRFSRLYNEHRTAVVAYCLRRTGQHDAMDAVAETFAIAWRRFEAIPSGDAELSWLYAVAYRVLANQYRSRDRIGHLRAKLTAAGSPVVMDPGTELVHAERNLQALDALAQLRPRDQEVLRLITWEERPREQVARMLRITRPALDQRYHRAVIRLRRAYEKVDTSQITTPSAAKGEA